MKFHNEFQPELEFSTFSKGNNDPSINNRRIVRISQWKNGARKSSGGDAEV